MAVIKAINGKWGIDAGEGWDNLYGLTFEELKELVADINVAISKELKRRERKEKK